MLIRLATKYLVCVSGTHGTNGSDPIPSAEIPDMCKY